MDNLFIELLINSCLYFLIFTAQKYKIKRMFKNTGKKEIIFILIFLQFKL